MRHTVMRNCVLLGMVAILMIGGASSAEADDEILKCTAESIQKILGVPGGVPRDDRDGSSARLYHWDSFIVDTATGIIRKRADGAVSTPVAVEEWTVLQAGPGPNDFVAVYKRAPKEKVYELLDAAAGVVRIRKFEKDHEYTFTVLSDVLGDVLWTGTCQKIS
jgi:hypothetical protein